MMSLKKTPDRRSFHFGYASCYDCHDVILLYPHHEKLGPDAGVRGSYLLNSWVCEVSNQKGRRVRVATINLENLKTAPAQLRQIILPEESVVKAISR